MFQFFIGPIHQYGTSLAILLLMAGAAAVVCFLGYALYRLVLIAAGAFAGIQVGGLLVRHLVAAPAGLDYNVTCACMAVLLAMLCYFLHRAMFCVLILLGAALLIRAQAIAHGQPWPAVVIGFAALIAASLSFIYLRQIFIFFTALAGGFYAVGALSELVNWSSVELRVVLIVLTGGALAALGMRVQWKLSLKLRSQFSPTSRKDRRA